MNVMRKRLISLNLAILMLLSLVLPAGAAELGEPAAVLTAEQSVAQTGEPVVQGLVDTGANTGTKIMATFVDQTGKTLATVDASADGWMPPALPSTEGEGRISTGQEAIGQRTGHTNRCNASTAWAILSCLPR